MEKWFELKNFMKEILEDDSTNDDIKRCVTFLLGVMKLLERQD
jgi:hypothetical protein